MLSVGLTDYLPFANHFSLLRWLSYVLNTWKGRSVNKISLPGSSWEFGIWWQYVDFAPWGKWRCGPAWGWRTEVSDCEILRDGILWYGMMVRLRWYWEMGGDGGWEALDYQLWGSLNCCERGRARLMRRSDRKCDKTTPAQSRWQSMWWPGYWNFAILYLILLSSSSISTSMYTRQAQEY